MGLAYKAGNYNVTLTVTDDDGDSGSDRVIIRTEKETGPIVITSPIGVPLRETTVWNTYEGYSRNPLDNENKRAEITDVVLEGNYPNDYCYLSFTDYHNRERGE
jgi:hypothetical protein